MNRFRKVTVTLVATVVLFAAAAAMGALGITVAQENSRDNPDPGLTAPGTVLGQENSRDNPDPGLTAPGAVFGQDGSHTTVYLG